MMNISLHDILPSVNYQEHFNMKTIEDILVNRTNTIWIDEIIKFTKIINELCKNKINIYYWSYDDKFYIPYEKGIIMSLIYQMDYIFGHQIIYTNY